MERVLVERSFAEPTELERVQALEDAVAWCLEQHGVRFLQTYFARDRRRMICLYDAPDAEAVRYTQREGGLPFDRIWTARVCEAPSAPPANARDEHVIIERNFPSPMTPADIFALFANGGSCFETYRVKPVTSFLSTDGLRTICYFRGPDADSVRFASDRGGLPYERAWTASVHTPP